ncbi:hypothetical protein [Solitalea canadensis]|uniref:hypothetical protein n=1 Tax=Solitalea canadensis TaxID=995 RepID=UPI0006936516|nr:hypothetical protein [Solitalea canadensis]
MIQSLQPFIKKTLLFSFIVAAVIAGIQYFFSEKNLLLKQIWVFFIFFNLITLFTFALSAYGLKKGGETSVLAVLVTIVVKMLLCMSVALVFIMKQMVEDKWVFITNFFLLYLLYTVFEVYNLIYNLRDQKKLENR